jgi:bifunctional non-homologous end joining protein LigD
VSNLDKVFYPGAGPDGRDFTKGDVFEYYRAVADAMLPHLVDRPLTLRRYPDGITGQSWFQKHASDYFPDWIDSIGIRHKNDDGITRYVLCQNVDTLLYLVNQATLEFHVWTATTTDLDKADRMVIDLDPPDGDQLPAVRDTAKRAGELLRDIGLRPFVQTTGGKGFHVVVPLDGTDDHDAVNSLAKGIAARLAADNPDRLTTEQYKNKRGERIFLDVNRNGYGQTWVCPYSLRGRDTAAAATPLEWRELPRVTPTRYGLANLSRRLGQKQDPWSHIAQHAGNARTAAKSLG